VSKVRTTLTIDESVMKAVKMRAARTGRGDSQVIEESLRRDLGLDLLERLWERNNLSEREATALAVEAQHQTRRRRRWQVRVVLDPNVVISGALTPRGAPADVLRSLARGEFELIASQALLDELQRALAYPKLRLHISESDAADLVRWVAGTASVVVDPDTDPPVRSRDPDDDYLIVLASSHRAALVSGDKHVLSREGDIPVFSPRAFLDLLAGAWHTRLTIVR
jgi:uncharacterized protein